MSQTYRIGTLNFTGSQAVLSSSLDVSGSGRFTNGLVSSGSITLSMLSTDDGSGNYDSNRLFFRGLGVGAVPQQGSIYLDANNGAGGEFLNIASDGGVKITASTLLIPPAINNVNSEGISLTANSTTNGLLLRQGYNQTSGYLLNVVNNYLTSSLAIHANSYNTVVGKALTPSDTGYTLQVLNTGASGSLFVSGSTTITDVLTLPFQHPLPSNKATGSVALSGSSGAFEGMYVYNGTSWINVKA